MKTIRPTINLLKLSWEKPFKREGKENFPFHRLHRFVLYALFIFCINLIPPFGATTGSSQGMSVNATGATPDNSSMLDVSATDKGLLIPRMTTTQRNAIASPAHSLMIYNLTTDCLELYNASSSIWVSIGCTGCQLPGSFTATTATNITGTSFDANWTASTGATNYYLDVAIDTAFTTFVTGYNNLSVGNVITYSVDTNLACATTYYYRLRAENSCGTSINSNIITLTTPSCVCTVTCGTQSFACTNINVGTMITSAPGGQLMTAPGGNEKYCYNDILANCTTYGGMYEWDEAMDYASSINCDPCGSSGVQGICPAGYHMPTDLEWSRYEYCLESTISPTGGTTLATFQTVAGWRGTNSAAGPGAKMKDDVTWNGTNTSGFKSVPAGYRYGGTGSFLNLTSFSYHWSATEISAANAWYRRSYSSESRSNRVDINKPFGFSVRCLQD